MAEDKTASFGIRIPVETNADDAADSVEALRKSITASQDAVKGYSSSLRNLRGTSDEVKGAKEKLKAAINAERDIISQSTLALGKHGTTLTETARKAKGPAADLAKHFADLKEKFVGAGSAANVAVIGLGLVAAAVLAVSAATVAGAIKLGAFILEMGNLTRTQSLFREAATGSAENAKAFGHQIDAIAGKVPQGRAELEALSVSLSKSLVNTRVSGQGIVDTFNAVAQASAAMGDDAGKAIEGIISRGKMMGRISLGVNELQGTGVGFQDVAAALAKNLHISVGQAQNELFMGRVKIDAGAKALRDAVEKNFAGINLRRMLDLNVIGQKLRDTFQQMTKDINLEPLQAGFAKLAGLFGTNTVTGLALKGLVTDFGNVMTKVFVAGLPFVEAFFNQIIIESLQLEIALIKAGIWVKQTFGVDFLSSLGDADLAITAAKVSFGVFVVTLGLMAAAAALVVAPFVALAWVFAKALDAGKALSDWFFSYDWKTWGTDITDGLVAGIKAGAGAVIGAVKGLGSSIKNAFTADLSIHSPSKVFRVFGQAVPDGAAQGVKDNTPKVNAAVASMVTVPRTNVGAAAGGPAVSSVIDVQRGDTRGSGGPTTVTVNLNFPNVQSGSDVSAALTAPSFRAQFTKLLEEICLGSGVPTHTAQAEVT